MENFWKNIASGNIVINDDDISDAITAFEAIKTAKGRNDKKALLAKHDDNNVLKLMCWLTYNNYLNFWLREIDAKPNGKDFNNFQQFCKLLLKLESREVTGNSARKEVNEFFCTLDKTEFTWYSAVFLRDLDIGISTKTINVVYENLIPVFEVQLASKYDGKCSFEKEKYVVEPKMDGSRAIIFTNSNGEAYDIVSRNGKQLYNVDAILTAVTQLSIKDSAIDCEVMASDWNDSISIIHTQGKHKKLEGLKAHIFDCIPIDDFKRGICKIPLNKRTAQIRERLKSIQSKYLVRVPRWKVEKSEDIDKYLSKAISAGFEGLILKDITAPYEASRTKSWQKIKLETSYDSEILDINISKSFDDKNIVLIGKGEVISKYEEKFKKIHGAVNYSECIDLLNKLSDYVVSKSVVKEAIDKLPEYIGRIDIPMIKNFKVKVLKKDVSVGSGFSYVERIVFALIKDHLIGKIIEFKGQKDSKAVTDGVRFPVFVKFRPDKDTESID